MFARKIHVQFIKHGGMLPCPLVWLDSFFMRNFVGRSAFDQSLPIADGLIETGFSTDLQALKSDLEDWFTRKFGEGASIHVVLTEISLNKTHAL